MCYQEHHWWYEELPCPGCSTIRLFNPQRMGVFLSPQKSPCSLRKHQHKCLWVSTRCLLSLDVVLKSNLSSASTVPATSTSGFPLSLPVPTWPLFSWFSHHPPSGATASVSDSTALFSGVKLHQLFPISACWQWEPCLPRAGRTQI